jgi:hypothetical protein
MTGYYTVPASMTAGTNDVAALEPWVTKAFEPAAALPPKVSRPRSGTKNPKAKEDPAHP